MSCGYLESLQLDFDEQAQKRNSNVALPWKILS